METAREAVKWLLYSNTLKETPTNRCNPLSFKVRIPPRAPGGQEVLDLEVEMGAH